VAIATTDGERGCQNSMMFVTLVSVVHGMRGPDPTDRTKGYPTAREKYRCAKLRPLSRCEPACGHPAIPAQLAKRRCQNDEHRRRPGARPDTRPDRLSRQEFSGETRAAATVVPGSVQVTFKEWPVATQGAFPHDPLATADGAVWYTGQRASLLAGSIRRAARLGSTAPVRQNSGPHGLTADAAGNIWFTANQPAM